MTPEQKIEKLKSLKDFAMFSKAGNNRVRTITVRAHKKEPHGVDRALELAEGMLNQLSRDSRYGEAMDTAVRDAVYGSLSSVKNAR